MVGIDPITVERLRAFGRRRHRLISLRGVCAGLVGLVGAMLVIAMLDRWVVLPDWTRWALSLGAYALTGAAVWMTCLRLLVHSPSQKQLARLLEKARPDLREDLISAIELGAHPEVRDGENGSPVFRRLLQADVADRIRGVQVDSLLPLRRVTRWMWTSLAIGLVCIALALLPNLSFGRLFLRAMAPGANIDRVSSVHVKIVEPAPADRPVAIGQSVDVVVELSGADAQSARIETRQSGKGRERSTMSRRGNRTFAAEIAVDQQPIQYRIFAGDAVSAWHELRPYPSPYVTGFVKSYIYPRYSGLQPVTRRENDGTVEAIEGATVDLAIETDQPCTGELRIRSGNQAEQIVALSGDDQHRLHGALGVRTSGTYQVRLISTSTALESRFNPNYAIKAQVDAPPRVAILAPDSGALFQPDDVIDLVGRAEDDICLARVEQWVQINGAGPWQKAVLGTDAVRQLPISTQWDLLKLNVQGGDIVATKLVAIDNKGNQSESSPLQVRVNFRNLKPTRFEALDATRQALLAIDKLLSVLEEHAPGLKSALTDASADVGNLARLHADLQDSEARLAQIVTEGNTALAQINASLLRVPRGQDVTDLWLCGRAVADVIDESARDALLRLDNLKNISPEGRADQLKLAIAAVENGRKHIGTISYRYRKAVGQETAGAALTDLHLLLTEQARLVKDRPPAADDLVGLRRIARVMDLILLQSKPAEQLLETFDSSYFGGDDSREMSSIAKSLVRQGEGIQAALADLLDDQRYASAPPDQMHMGRWQAIGPFSVTSDDEELEPERNLDLTRPVGDLRWAEHAEYSDGGDTLRSMPLIDGQAMYLYRSIQSTGERQLPFFIGGAGTIKVWFNGSVVIDIRRQRNGMVDQLKREVTLRPGQNHLLVKLVNYGLGSVRSVPRTATFYFRAAGEGREPVRLGSPGQRLIAASSDLKAAMTATIERLSPRYETYGHNMVGERRQYRWATNPIAGRLADLDKARINSFKAGPDGRQVLPNELADFTNRHLPTVASVLATYSTIGEVRVDADSQFFLDTGNVARALVRIRQKVQAAGNDPAAVYAAAEPVATLAAAYQVLEAAHDVAGVRDTAEEMLTIEKWAGQTSAAVVAQPGQWIFFGSETDVISGAITRPGIPTGARGALRGIPSQPYGRQLAAEMKRRLDSVVEPASMLEQLEQVNADVAQTLKIMEPAVQQARKQVEALAPGVPELIQTAAAVTRQLEKETREASAMPPSAGVGAAKLALIEEQERQAIHAVWTIMAALRQDANRQNHLYEQQRQRARDADDAIGILRAGTVRTVALLAETNKAPNPPAHKKALGVAADGSGELAAAIEQIAIHYAALAGGKDSSPTRQALRAAEEKLGTRDTLDADYAKLARLAELSQIAQRRGPIELMKELQKDLASDRAMQRELQQLTRNMARQALVELKASAEDQRQLAEDLRQVALARGELNDELMRDVAGFQASLADLAGRQLPALREVVRAGGVDVALPPLEEAARLAREAVAAAPAAGTPLKQSSDALDTQAQAIAKSLGGFTDAAIAVDGQAVEQARPALDLARKATEAAAAQEKLAREAAEAMGKADEAAKSAADQAHSTGDPADQKAADKAAAEAKAAHASAESAQRQLDVARKAVQEARVKAQEARKILDELLARLGEAQTSARNLSQHASRLSAQVRLATTSTTRPDLAQALGQAAGQQQAVAGRVEAAAVLIARAAEHEHRLGNAALSKALGQRVVETSQLAAGEMLEASRMFPALPSAAMAQTDVAAIEGRVRAVAKALEAVLFPDAATNAAAGTGSDESDEDLTALSPREIEVARQLARTIDVTAEASGAARRMVAAAEGQLRPATAPATTQAATTNPMDAALRRGLGGLPDAVRLTVEQIREQSARRPTSPTPQPPRRQPTTPQTNPAGLTTADPNQQPTPTPETGVDLNPEQTTQKGNTPQMADAARLLDVAARLNSRQMVQQRADIPALKPEQNRQQGPPMGQLNTLRRPDNAREIDPLRRQMAQDLASGSQETIPEADRAAIEAYFRALAKETAAPKSDDGTQVPGPAGRAPRRSRSR